MIRTSAVLLLALLLPACGPDEAPEVEVPSWAKVAPEQIADAAKHGVPVAFENDLGMRFVLIPAGTFLMGSPEDEDGHLPDEVRRSVEVKGPLYLQATEVTNEQFRQFKPAHRSSEGLPAVDTLDGDQQPVVNVDWATATEFAGWVSRRSGDRSVRLPSEAEWEYACRAGTATPYSFGGEVSPRLANLKCRGRYVAHRGMGIRTETSAEVGSFSPNPWGLYDMHGNVWEWCLDEYEGMGLRVVRGGSWVDEPLHARSASRTGESSKGGSIVGFRLVSPLPEPSER